MPKGMSKEQRMSRDTYEREGKREWQTGMANGNGKREERCAVWQGDYRLIVGIIKHLEDRMNVDHDTRLVGVQCIIFIEDNVRHYSTLLPILYTELLNQSQRLTSEGINVSHKSLRTVARPKILLCQTYEEAWRYYETYKEHVLGIVSDIDFPRNGKPDHGAGTVDRLGLRVLGDRVRRLLRLRGVHQASADERVGQCSFRPSPDVFAERGVLVEHVVEVAWCGECAKELGHLEVGGEHGRAGLWRKCGRFGFRDALGEALRVGHFGEDGFKRGAVNDLRIRAEAISNPGSGVAPGERFASRLGGGEVTSGDASPRLDGLALFLGRLAGGEQRRT